MVRIERQFPTAYTSRQPLRFHPECPEKPEFDVLEIGPGRGDLLFAMAESFRETRFVAVELGKKRYHKLVARVGKRGLDNIQLVQGDARLFVPRYIPEHSLREIYVLFPDPWPKRRHAFHRLLSVEFMATLTVRLRDEGLLILKTDVKSYADWMAANAGQLPSLARDDGAQATATRLEPDVRMTHFEQKWIADGAAIHTQIWRKNAAQ